MSTLRPTIGIGDTFLKSLIALPDVIMKKTRETMTKFRNDPTSPGLNYETINRARDRRLHSIRIDQTYRCIVLKPDKGDAYIFLWVDKHDDAYDWARGRSCGVNTQTGSIEVMEVDQQAAPVEVVDPEPSQQEEDNKPGIFEMFTDRDLIQLGAEEDLLPLIRSIKDGPQLELFERRFPPLVYEALFMLACGEQFDVVLDELGIETGREFDPDDFATALGLDTNQRHFASISDDAELEGILNEPLALWRVYLHPSQRKLVRANFNGPARVLGGAGTGKTVVAMHRARHLASECGDNERILFTTFTKSLINDIKQNLQKICSYDEIKKIEVIHLDAWCRNFLTSQNYKHETAYDSKHNLRDRLWSKALEQLSSGAYSSDFLRDEWERVIQYHDIEDFADYARVPRTGRRGRLSRLQRKEIWAVFQEYRTLLNENQLWEPPDMMRAARSILEANQLNAGFKHIIVDEIQDFHPQSFRLLRAMIPADQFPKNDLFLVGDGHQNIYGHHVVLSQLGIDIRGRGRRLRLNYRTPEETRRWASSVLTGIEVSDLDGDTDNDRGYRSVLSGPTPSFKPANSFDEEIETISSWIRSLKESRQDDVACIAVRTNRERSIYADALRSGGFAVHELTEDAHDIEDPGPVRLSTMYRIKGLEFDHVCLAGLGGMDWSGYEDRRRQSEKCLLHVAATRTKNSLLVTADEKVAR